MNIGKKRERKKARRKKLRASRVGKHGESCWLQREMEAGRKSRKRT